MLLELKRSQNELKRSQDERFEELNKMVEANKRPKISITTYGSAGAHLIHTTSIFVPQSLVNIRASSVPSDIVQLCLPWNACTKEEELQVIKFPTQITSDRTKEGSPNLKQ